MVKIGKGKKGSSSVQLVWKQGQKWPNLYLWLPLFTALLLKFAALVKEGGHELTKIAFLNLKVLRSNLAARRDNLRS